MKIQQLTSGQLLVSIPKAMAVALNLKKGESMTWKLDVGAGHRLYLERSK